MHKSSIPLFVVASAIGVSISGCADPGPKALSHVPEPVFRSRDERVARIRRTIRPAPIVRAPAPAPSDPGLPAGIELPPSCCRAWKYIVIHHSGTDAGSASRFDGFHRSVRGWDELGYHFVIGNGQGASDGLIEVGSRWWKQKHGAHCKTADNRFNEYGIGICLVGNFQTGSPTGAQMRSLENLLQHLMRAHRISLSEVYGHGAITHRTACPGAYFPLDDLKRKLGSLAFGRF